MLSYDFSMRLPRFTPVLTWSTVMLALAMAASYLQAQTPESKSSQKLTEKDRVFVIKSLKDSRERFVTAVAGLSEAQWKFEWAPGSSIYSAAAHITLSEEFIFNIILNEVLKTPATPEKQRTTTDEKVFWDSEEGIDDPGAGLGDVDLTWNSINEMMKEFESRRSRAIEFVKTTKDDLRVHFAPLGDRGELDALQWFLVLSGHCEFHVAMIDAIKAETNFPNGRHTVQDKKRAAANFPKRGRAAQDEKLTAVPVQFENEEDGPLVIQEARAGISAPYETIMKGTKGDGQEVALINKGERARRIKLTLTMVNKSNLTVFHCIVRLFNPAFLSDESILVGSRLWIRNPGWPLEIKPLETITVTTDLPLADRRNGQELANHLSGFRVKVVETGFTPEGSPYWTEGGDFSNLYGRVEDMVMAIDCAGGTVFRLVKKRSASEPPPSQISGQTSSKLAPQGILVPTESCEPEPVYKQGVPFEIGRPAPDGLQASGGKDSETPRILYQEKAKYTEDARRSKTQGMVLLYVLFNASGTISDISVKAGLPDGLTEKAIEAAKKIRFQPAVKDGVPVGVRGPLLFSFTLY